MEQDVIDERSVDRDRAASTQPYTFLGMPRCTIVLADGLGRFPGLIEAFVSVVGIALVASRLERSAPSPRVWVTVGVACPASRKTLLVEASMANGLPDPTPTARDVAVLANVDVRTHVVRLAGRLYEPRARADTDRGLRIVDQDRRALAPCVFQPPLLGYGYAATISASASATHDCWPSPVPPPAAVVSAGGSSSSRTLHPLHAATAAIAATTTRIHREVCMIWQASRAHERRKPASKKSWNRCGASVSSVAARGALLA